MNPRNEAQEDRGARDHESKNLTDTPRLGEGDGETWESATGHSGTRRSWAVSLGMVSSFLLAAGGMTFGPRTLLWIGVGLFCALGVYSLASRSWTDVVHDRHPPET